MSYRDDRRKSKAETLRRKSVRAVKYAQHGETRVTR